MIMIMSIRPEKPNTRACCLSRGQFDWNRCFLCELIKNGFLICVRTNKDTSRSCHILNVTWKRKTESIVELISRKSQILAKTKNFVHFLNHHHQHSPSVCVVKSHIEDSHWPWRSPGRLLMLLNVENCPLMHQICGSTLANFQSRQVWKISLDMLNTICFSSLHIGVTSLPFFLVASALVYNSSSRSDNDISLR